MSELTNIFANLHFSIVIQPLFLIGLFYTVRTIKRNGVNAEVTNYHNAIKFQKDTWLKFFLEDSQDGAEMLAWHLECRGIKTQDHIENKKALFILLRLDIYEEILLSKQKNILTKDQIIGWGNAIKRDFSTDKYCEIWKKVSDYYHPALKQYIDSFTKENR